MAAQLFIRWARLGVWDRLLGLALECRVTLGMAFLDTTSVRRTTRRRGRPKRGNCAGNGGGEALGRSRGGYGTKAVVIADGAGRPVAFRLAPGQAHELPHALPLLAQLPGVPRPIVVDRGYSCHAFREHDWSLGTRPAVPPKRNKEQVACPAWACHNRSRVERLWARLKK